MLVLALDTALTAATALVADAGRVLAVRCRPMARGHQEAIATLTREAMAEASVAFRDLDRIGVTVGPGSFTGLRVGLAFAKGLALAWDTPLVGIGTLEALLASVEGGRVLASVDAGRGQVYLQLEGGRPQQVPLEDALTLAEDFRPGLIVGSGAALLAQVAPGAKLEPLEYPIPGSLARLTMAAPKPNGPPKPLYLRAPDAKTLAERGIVR